MNMRQGMNANIGAVPAPIRMIDSPDTNAVDTYRMRKIHLISRIYSSRSHCSDPKPRYQGIHVYRNGPSTQTIQKYGRNTRIMAMLSHVYHGASP